MTTMNAGNMQESLPLACWSVMSQDDWLALVYCCLLDDDWIVIHLTKDSHCLFLTAVAVR